MAKFNKFLSALILDFTTLAAGANSTTGNGLSFNDFVNGIDDPSGGNLIAEVVPIPFEFSPVAGLVVLGSWGVCKSLININNIKQV
jgi:hypothetical protein